MNLNIKAYSNNKNKPTIPYTYSVTHKTSGIHYYGSRYCKGCSPDDFFKTYFTSSKIIQDLIKREGIDSFTFKIRKKFKTHLLCTAHESRFLKRVDAKNNPKFFNRQNEALYTNSGFALITNGSITIRWPKEKAMPQGFIIGTNRKNITSSVKGRKWIHNPITKETRMIKPEESIPEGFLPNRPPEYFTEHSKKMKSKQIMYITNGIDSKFINKNEPIPDGWRKGRTFKNKENLGKRSYKYITITNGDKNTHLKIGEPIPEGWRIGKTIKTPRKKISYKYVLITDGTKDMQLKTGESMPEGWRRGVKPRKKTGKRSYEYIMITDGKQTKFLKTGESIPRGWKRGRIIRNKENLGKCPYKYIGITDGDKNKKLKVGEPIPEGWRRGETKKPRKK
jgi:hypothetical protein